MKRSDQQKNQGGRKGAESVLKPSLARGGVETLFGFEQSFEIFGFNSTSIFLSGINCTYYINITPSYDLTSGFVLLRFRLYAFVEAAALRSIILRYAVALIASPRTSFFLFSFCLYLEMPLFPSIFCTIAVFSSYGEYIVRSLLPDGVFLPCDHGLDC